LSGLVIIKTTRRPCGKITKSLFPFTSSGPVNFPEKTSVFPAPLGLVTSAQRVPAQTKKKEKIGTIFCPKGGLAVVPLNNRSFLIWRDRRDRREEVN
jgi:hypothetical protein